LFCEGGAFDLFVINRRSSFLVGREYAVPSSY